MQEPLPRPPQPSCRPLNTPVDSRRRRTQQQLCGHNPQPDVTKPCGKIECVHYLSRAICLHSLSDLPELLSCMALVTWANMAICLAALHHQRDIDMCTVSIKHLSVGYHIGFNARRALHARNPCQSYIQPACKLARRIATLRFRRTRRKPQTSVIGKLLQFCTAFYITLG